MPPVPSQDAPSGRAALAIVLLAAAALRLSVVATQTYVAWPDETFQYLEPAHRLLFGAGVITWEYLDGIRSWLLPGLVAGVMGLVSLVRPDPAAYVGAARLVAVLASLAVPYAGFRLVARRCGVAAGLLAGLLCALGSESVYFAPTILAEPLATDAALLAIVLSDGGGPRRRVLMAGLLFGLAVSLRYQYGPVLAIVATVQYRRSPRDLMLAASAGLGVVAVVLGGLDWLSWGAPFQSVWLNYRRNAIEGVSSAIGTQPFFYYLEYYRFAWGAAAPALGLAAAVGAWRMQVLGLVVLLTIGLHTPVPHKELRFVFLATACVPMLVGAGVGTLLERLKWPSTGRLLGAGLLAAVVAGLTAVQTYRFATPANAWHRSRSVLQATAAARALPGVCGAAIRGEAVNETGGYTYWHRNTPLLFESWDPMQRVDGIPFPLRLESVLNGQPVPQYPGAALAANTGRFNVLIGGRHDGLPGFERRDCFGRGTPDDPAFCVFMRPGGCG